MRPSSLAFLKSPQMHFYLAGGSLIYALGLNYFIIPLGLYTGGFLGISQLLLAFLQHVFGLNYGQINWAGILYFIFNLPMLYLAKKRFGNEFIYKTIYCVSWYSFLITIIPINDHLVVQEPIVNCLAGAIICGIGQGLTLLSKGSGGGEEILGLLVMQKKPSLSIGKVSYILNFFIYSICALAFNLSIAIYSIFFTGIVYYVLDKIHFSNIMLTLTIITKKEGLENIIFENINRGVTRIPAYGAYSNAGTNVLMTVVSKSEFLQIRPLLLFADKDVFIIVNESNSVVGNFQKRL